MTVPKTLFVLSALVCGLAGCGGGGGDGGPLFTGPVSGIPYQSLNSTAEQTSMLTGTSLVINNSAGTLTLTSASGSVTHNTGATTLNDGVYTLVDPNGIDSIGRLTDGTVTSETLIDEGLLSGYQHLGVYLAEYSTGGQDYFVLVTGGIGTLLEDMPTGGTATYDGRSVVTVASPFENTILEGDALVLANFATGTASVTLDNFTAETFQGAPTTTAIGRITASPMAITSNSFSGGTVVVQDSGGNVITPTGPGTIASAQGDFYGINAGDQPAEVGGHLLLDGGVDAAAYGTFFGKN